jgi:galactofuranose transport system ATP-binding protein
MASESNALLRMEGIRIGFPGVKALDGVDFNLMPGEVHALMGQNGAGKSTLIKVLTGVYQPDSGEIVLEGRGIRPESPSHAESLGISTVYQEVNLCPNLSVAENMMIGREPRRFGLIDWREMNRRTDALLKEKLNVSIDVTKPLSEYSVAIQQMVAIARALMSASKILILDEPTSSLDDSEVSLLFGVMRKLRAEGMGIIFITHFLNQTYEISDRITILQNGKLVSSHRASELERIDLISKMIGKDYGEYESMIKSERSVAPKACKDALVELEGFGCKGLIAPMDLSIGKCETVGLAGLLGSGRTETAKLIFGLARNDSGQMRVNGKRVVFRNPLDALKKGLGFCPEDRKAEAVFGEFTVRENIAIALQARTGFFKYMGKKKQKQIAEEYVQLLGIKTPNVDQQLRFLSGGNQQKVILARWLLTKPSLLILDEPTRGIDVSAKAEIQKLIMTLCDEGMSILFISSELEEVVRVSSRVAVLRDREKIAELPGEGLNEADILHVIAKGEKDA